MMTQWDRHWRLAITLLLCTVRFECVLGNLPTPPGYNRPKVEAPKSCELWTTDDCDDPSLQGHPDFNRSCACVTEFCFSCFQKCKTSPKSDLCTEYCLVHRQECITMTTREIETTTLKENLSSQMPVKIEFNNSSDQPSADVKMKGKPHDQGDYSRREIILIAVVCFLSVCTVSVCTVAALLIGCSQRRSRCHKTICPWCWCGRERKSNQIGDQGQDGSNEQDLEMGSTEGESDQESLASSVAGGAAIQSHSSIVAKFPTESAEILNAIVSAETFENYRATLVTVLAMMERKMDEDPSHWILVKQVWQNLQSGSGSSQFNGASDRRPPRVARQLSIGAASKSTDKSDERETQTGLNKEADDGREYEEQTKIPLLPTEENAAAAANFPSVCVDSSSFKHSDLIIYDAYRMILHKQQGAEEFNWGHMRSESLTR